MQPRKKKKGKTSHDQEEEDNHNDILKTDIMISGTSLNAGIKNLWNEIQKKKDLFSKRRRIQFHFTPWIDLAKH